MAFEPVKVTYSGEIMEVSFGQEGKELTVGGEKSYPFHNFEHPMPHRPVLAMEVWDMNPEEWPKACSEPFADVMADTGAWAKKCVEEFGAEAIVVQLKSTDPNADDAPPENASEAVGKVLSAVDVPVIVWGSANAHKDAEVLKKVAEDHAGKKLVLGPVDEDNHKAIGAAALAYGHSLVASSPIDVNLAKQLNILLGNLGVDMGRIMIDPTTGGLGYGMEYSYSVMERIRMAALVQEDDKLILPLINNVGNEVWKSKEARIEDEEAASLNLGDDKKRGVLMEATAAVSYLMAGSDILILRHPDSIALMKTYLDKMLAEREPAAEKEVVDRPKVAKADFKPAPPPREKATAKPAEAEAKPPEPEAQPAEAEAKPPEPGAQPAEAEAKPPEPEAKPAEAVAKPPEPEAKPAEAEAKPLETPKTAEISAALGLEALEKAVSGPADLAETAKALAQVAESLTQAAGVLAKVAQNLLKTQQAPPEKTKPEAGEQEPPKPAEAEQAQAEPQPQEEVKAKQPETKPQEAEAKQPEPAPQETKTEQLEPAAAQKAKEPEAPGEKAEAEPEQVKTEEELKAEEEEQKRIQAEKEEAERKAKEEAKAKAEEEARLKAEEEARLKAEEEAREKARQKTEQEANLAKLRQERREAQRERLARMQAERAALDDEEEQVEYGEFKPDGFAGAEAELVTHALDRWSLRGSGFGQTKSPTYTRASSVQAQPREAIKLPEPTKERKAIWERKAKEAEELAKLRAGRREHRLELAAEHQAELRSKEKEEPLDIEYGEVKQAGQAGAEAEQVTQALERWSLRDDEIRINGGPVMKRASTISLSKLRKIELPELSEEEKARQENKARQLEELAGQRRKRREHRMEMLAKYQAELEAREEDEPEEIEYGEYPLSGVAGMDGDYLTKSLDRWSLRGNISGSGNPAMVRNSSMVITRQKEVKETLAELSEEEKARIQEELRQSQELSQLRAKRRDRRRELAEKHKQEKEELELLEPEEMEYGSYREKGVSGPGADYILRSMERWQSRS